MLMRVTGLEPIQTCLEDKCPIQLGYTRNKIYHKGIRACYKPNERPRNRTLVKPLCSPTRVCLVAIVPVEILPLTHPDWDRTSS